MNDEFKKFNQIVVFGIKEKDDGSELAEKIISICNAAG